MPTFHFVIDKFYVWKLCSLVVVGIFETTRSKYLINEPMKVFLKLPYKVFLTVNNRFVNIFEKKKIIFSA